MAEELEDRRFGSNFYEMLRLLRTKKYKSRAALGRDLGLTRARVGQMLTAAVASGALKASPFKEMPTMARAHTRRNGSGSEDSAEYGDSV